MDPPQRATAEVPPPIAQKPPVTMTPSSSVAGFFQKLPTIPPQYEEDLTLRRIISLHLPTPTPSPIHQDLLRFSKLMLSPRIINYIADAERNVPYLRPLGTFGAENRTTSLATSEGWRALQDIGYKEGVVVTGYEDGHGEWNSRMYMFLKYHIWSGSAAMVTCPNAMQDGAAFLLEKHLDGENGDLFKQVRKRLLSRDLDQVWTSGQWMTERTGGSDVRGTETVARKLKGSEVAGVDAVGMPLGPWRIDGFKWFSSATDAHMAIILAKTGSNGGLSTFYAPMWRQPRDDPNGQAELNGVRIQRLKNKMGTKTLPTAELELKEMRGYLIGKEGQGVKEIVSLVNITRIHNVVSSVGFWGRGLAIARAFARVRITSGRLLVDTPAHVRGLAREHVKYRGHMHLTFFLVALLGRVEGKGESQQTAAGALFPRSKEDVPHLLRLLTPLAKAQTALASTNGLRECMESLGGVGYLENEDTIMNVARLFRDSSVLSIWEGTTDVMADDVMRVVKGKDGPRVLSVFDVWVKDATAVGQGHPLRSEATRLLAAWQTWLEEVQVKSKDELKWNGRPLMQDLDTIVCGILLLLDAERDGDDIAIEIAKRWVRKNERTNNSSWNQEAVWDRRIVFDEGWASSKL